MQARQATAVVRHLLWAVLVGAGVLAATVPAPAAQAHAQAASVVSTFSAHPTGHGAMIARDHRRSCTFGYTFSVPRSHNLAQLTLHQTCGVSLRAVGDWQNTGTHYGTYRKTPPGGTKYSVACGEPSTCGSGGGTLFWAGYERKDTGHITCLFSCAASRAPPAHTTALARLAGRVVPGPCNQGTVITGLGLGNSGYVQAKWSPDSDSSTTDGCAALWTWAKDTCGHTKTSGKVYYDNGVEARATVPCQLQQAKDWVFINGCNIYKVVFSPTGTTGWKIANCPAALPRFMQRHLHLRQHLVLAA